MTPFVRHTVESAPAASRRLMEGTARHLGYLPAALGLLAESPELLGGFLQLSKVFESTTLDPVAREVVVLTIATRNGCHICVETHTRRLRELGAAADVITALRNRIPLPDDRLDAVRVFTLDVVAAAGGVDDESLARFLAHGFTTRNALEVVLGIGTYTMSTLANRLTKAPLDERLAANT